MMNARTRAVMSQVGQGSAPPPPLSSPLLPSPFPNTSWHILAAQEYIMLKQECTTPYMLQNIKINIGVGGLHGNQFAKNRPAKIS